VPDGIIIGALQEFLNKIDEQGRKIKPSFHDIFIHSYIVILLLTKHACFLVCEMVKK
jgi:hypothetical protein